MPRQRQHLRERQFGDADAVGTWCVHHDDPARGGRVEIDVVDAGAGARDDAQRRRGFDHLARDARRAAHDERVGISNSSQQFGERASGFRVDVPAFHFAQQGHSGSG